MKGWLEKRVADGTHMFIYWPATISAGHGRRMETPVNRIAQTSPCQETEKVVRQDVGVAGLNRRLWCSYAGCWIDGLMNRWVNEVIVT